MPTFVLLFDNERIKTYQINEPVITIGRLPENSISIVNMGISRRHARIERNPDGTYVVSDLNSLNGLFINNKKVTRCELKSGDRIVIGKYTILFESIEEKLHADTSAEENDADGNEDEKSNDRHTDTLSVPSPDPEKEEEGVAATGQSAQNNPVLIETNKHVVYKLDKPIMTLGSSEEDDIFIDGLFIDKSHVTLERQEDGYFIETRKMLSKMKINGKKTMSALLGHKDRIEIGSSTLRYMQNG